MSRCQFVCLSIGYSIVREHSFVAPLQVSEQTKGSYFTLDILRLLAETPVGPSSLLTNLFYGRVKQLDHNQDILHQTE